MNREVHARFWERPEVKLLRATRHVRLIGRSRCGSALTQYVVGVCAKETPNNNCYEFVAGLGLMV